MGFVCWGLKRACFCVKSVCLPSPFQVFSLSTTVSCSGIKLANVHMGRFSYLHNYPNVLRSCGGGSFMKVILVAIRDAWYTRSPMLMRWAWSGFCVLIWLHSRKIKQHTSVHHGFYSSAPSLPRPCRAELGQICNWLRFKYFSVLDSSCLGHFTQPEGPKGGYALF